jgi:anti-anti-sigma factor
MNEQVITAITNEQGTLLLQLHGDLDIATIPACRAELDDAIAESRPLRLAAPTSGPAGPVTVVLDLSGLTFLSAGGMRMLGDVARGLADRGIRTVLAAPPHSLTRRLMHLTEIDRLMKIVDGPYRPVISTQTPVRRLMSREHL